jgi:hypothetical protein
VVLGQVGFNSLEMRVVKEEQGAVAEVPTELIFYVVAILLTMQ